MRYLKKFHVFEQIKFKSSKEDEYNYITALSGPDVVGELTYHVELDDYYIIIDDVASKTHKNGVGTALMNKALSVIRKKYPNINVIMLNASPFGEPKIPLPKLVDFYKRFGFDVYMPEGGNVIMVKEFE